MMFACIQNCSVCPFQCRPRRPVQSPIVEPVGNSEQLETSVVKENLTTAEESSVTENGLSVVENIPVFEVKKNIFGKERVVRKA